MKRHAPETYNPVRGRLHRFAALPVCLFNLAPHRVELMVRGEDTQEGEIMLIPARACRNIYRFCQESSAETLTVYSGVTSEEWFIQIHFPRRPHIYTLDMFLK
jgi:hypothetical protein